MNVQKLTKLDFDSKGMKAFDWVLALGCLAYGIYASSAILIVGGVLGCVASYYRPLGKFQKWMDSFVRRRVN